MRLFTNSRMPSLASAVFPLLVSFSGYSMAASIHDHHGIFHAFSSHTGYTHRLQVGDVGTVNAQAYWHNGADIDVGVELIDGYGPYEGDFQQALNNLPVRNYPITPSDQVVAWYHKNVSFADGSSSAFLDHDNKEGGVDIYPNVRAENIKMENPPTGIYQFYLHNFNYRQLSDPSAEVGFLATSAGTAEIISQSHLPYLYQRVTLSEQDSSQIIPVLVFNPGFSTNHAFGTELMQRVGGMRRRSVNAVQDALLQGPINWNNPTDHVSQAQIQQLGVDPSVVEYLYNSMADRYSLDNISSDALSFDLRTAGSTPMTCQDGCPSEFLSVHSMSESGLPDFLTWFSENALPRVIYEMAKHRPEYTSIGPYIQARSWIPSPEVFDALGAALAIYDFDQGVSRDFSKLDLEDMRWYKPAAINMVANNLGAMGANIILSPGRGLGNLVIWAGSGGDEQLRQEIRNTGPLKVLLNPITSDDINDFSYGYVASVHKMNDKIQQTTIKGLKILQEPLGKFYRD